MAVSAAILLVLGVIHLAYTFHGNKLTPRDSRLHQAMRDTAPRLTRRTSMWLAWVGFNASHSMGAMLFGLIYGYFALVTPDMLFQSVFLQSVGAAMLAGYLVLGKRYWFSTPFIGICASSACYAAAVALKQWP